MNIVYTKILLKKFESHCSFHVQNWASQLAVLINCERSCVFTIEFYRGKCFQTLRKILIKHCTFVLVLHRICHIMLVLHALSDFLHRWKLLADSLQNAKVLKRSSGLIWFRALWVFGTLNVLKNLALLSFWHDVQKGLSVCRMASRSFCFTNLIEWSRWKSLFDTIRDQTLPSTPTGFRLPLKGVRDFPVYEAVDQKLEWSSYIYDHVRHSSSFSFYILRSEINFRPVRSTPIAYPVAHLKLESIFGSSPGMC